MSGRPGGGNLKANALYDQRLQRARSHNLENRNKPKLQANAYVSDLAPMVIDKKEKPIETKSKAPAPPKIELVQTKRLKIKVKARGKEKVLASVKLGTKSSEKEKEQAVDNRV